MLRCRCLQLCSVWQIKDRKNREGNLTIHEKEAYRVLFVIAKRSESRNKGFELKIRNVRSDNMCVA